MTNRRRIALRIRCVLLLGLGVASAGSVYADSVEASVVQWFEDVYAKGFVEGDPDFMDHYAEQVHLVIGQSARMLDKERLGAVIDEVYVQPWTKAGWETSGLIDVAAQGLGPDSAFVTAAWALLDAQGNNVAGCERPEWHYLLVHDGARWQVIAEIEGGCP